MIDARGRRAGHRPLHLGRDPAHPRHERLPQPDARRARGGLTDDLPPTRCPPSDWPSSSRSCPPPRTPRSAVRVATERAARVLEAEVAAVLDDRRRGQLGGFAFGRAPLDDLLAVVAPAAGLPLRRVPARGRCHTAVGAGLCRRHAAAVTCWWPAPATTASAVDEVSLLRGMARVLELTVATLRTFEAERRQAAENARLLDSLRERQRLLEQLSIIQRAITRRAPLQSILDAITAGAQELLRDEVAALHVLDPDDPGDDAAGVQHRPAGGAGPSAVADPVARRGRGRAARAAATTWSCATTRAGGPEPAIPELAAASVAGAMAAPGPRERRRRGQPGGRLVPARPASTASADRDVLSVFAEHVSLARHRRQDAGGDDAGLPRLADRAGQPRAVPRPAGPRAGPRRPGGRPGWRCSSSTSTGSRPSTTRSATPPATRCWSASPSGCAPACGTATPPPASAATSSRCCAEACDRGRGDRRSPSASSSGCGRRSSSTATRCSSTPASASPSTPAARPSATELIRDADLAMYQAKKKGKGRYEIFQPAAATRRSCATSTWRPAAPGGRPRRLRAALPADRAPGRRAGRRRGGAGALAATAHGEVSRRSSSSRWPRRPA